MGSKLGFLFGGMVLMKVPKRFFLAHTFAVHLRFDSMNKLIDTFHADLLLARGEKPEESEHLLNGSDH